MNNGSGENNIVVSVQNLQFNFESNNENFNKKEIMCKGEDGK